MYRTNTQSGELVTCEEAQEMLKISSRTLDNLIRSGRLRSALYSEVKVNQPRVFHRADIEKLKGGVELVGN